MKAAKTRHRIFTKNRQRPRYRLAELLAQMPSGRMELDADLKAWENMAPVGREFGAPPAEQI